MVNMDPFDMFAITTSCYWLMICFGRIVNLVVAVFNQIVNVIVTLKVFLVFLHFLFQASTFLLSLINLSFSFWGQKHRGSNQG